ncbi:MAG: hypothetical protein QM648_05810 [Solirubrobacterales bacterium]
MPTVNPSQRTSKVPQFAVTLVMVLLALAVGAVVVNAASKAGAAKKKKKSTPAAFLISGSLAGSLSPGVPQQLKLSLSNKKTVPIWVTKLSVALSIDAQHAAAGCSAARDFQVSQLPKTAYPYKLAKKKKASKKKKKKKQKIAWKPYPEKLAKGYPQVTMIDLPSTNQDACKGATINFHLTGKAQNKKPAKKKAAK